MYERTVASGMPSAMAANLSWKQRPYHAFDKFDTKFDKFELISQRLPD